MFACGSPRSGILDKLEPRRGAASQSRAPRCLAHITCLVELEASHAGATPHPHVSLHARTLADDAGPTLIRNSCYLLPHANLRTPSDCQRPARRTPAHHRVQCVAPLSSSLTLISRTLILHNPNPFIALSSTAPISMPAYDGIVDSYTKTDDDIDLSRPLPCHPYNLMSTK